MVAVIEILIAYTAVVTTIMGGVMMFLFRYFFPLKDKVNRIDQDLYNGKSGSGFVREVSESHDDLEESVDELRRSQREMSRSFIEMRRYLLELTELLKEENDIDESDLPDDPDARFSNDD